MRLSPFSSTEGKEFLFKAAGFRVKVDDRNEKMGKRIRESEMQKIPVMLILGDKDIENQTVSVRRRTEGDLGAMSLEAALTLFAQYRDA